MDEVVVTALGISREKKSLGYAVAEVKGDALQKVAQENVLNSLAGKVAGVSDQSDRYCRIFSKYGYPRCIFTDK